jgi:bacterioferritin-associated ferredoxin
MDLDSTLCYCFHIKKRKIVNFVKQTRPRRASQITGCYGAGTGCGWCIPFLKRIHRQIVAGDIVESDEISPAEYDALRAAYRAGVRDGTRDRNTRDTDALPPELEGKLGPLPAAAPGADLEDEASENEDWDVSDYFSRPRSPDPEPDMLE